MSYTCTSGHMGEDFGRRVYSLRAKAERESQNQISAVLSRYASLICIAYGSNAEILGAVIATYCS